jgi:two-component system chemotaxis response regulator CheB
MVPGARSYGRRIDTNAPVRVMLIDDSIVARSVFQSIVAPMPGFEIVATVSDVARAMTALETQPVDIILLDLALPGMDGLTALPLLIEKSHGARVLIVSASAGAGADACVRALTLGAADTLEKPSSFASGEAFRTLLTDKLRRIGAGIEPRAAAVTPQPVSDQPAQPPVSLRPPVAGPVECIAIGASTGGLHALSAFFGALPPQCVAPILVTQHLPATFMEFFAAQLSDIARRPATVARTGDLLRPGEILVAPGDAHLSLRRSITGEVMVALGTGPAVSGCLPSVDPMFAALAACFGPRGFAVVLSGMGRDGAIGARTMVEAGGEVVAQDRSSSVVWGMPGSVAARALASLVAPPARLAARLSDRLGLSVHPSAGHPVMS